MKTNTKKFLNIYFNIDEVEDEKLLIKLNKDLLKYGSKVTEEEFDKYMSDLCCEWEDFTNCYEIL